MPPIISVENLGKCYTIRHLAAGGPRYRRLSEEIASAVARPFRALLRGRRSEVRGQRSEIGSQRSEVGGQKSEIAPSKLATPCSRLPAPPASESFWALRDVSFDLQSGEVVGIIGRNGAGKSTLLKVLSRITEPSEGRVRIRGRVASLLEVGTGFHPELTGRENVYLNGAILGMSRAEIKRKFDEIVAFAEVEKFLDTPVKHFSSGMYVRLAFAVAAHLEPEILIVDEVLAVGDSEFQKKCLGKMQAVGSAGRTVLFVSHNMAAVRTLCKKSILLERGTVRFNGNVEACITDYQNTTPKAGGLYWTRYPIDTTEKLVFSEVSADVRGEQPNLTLAIRCKFAGTEWHRSAFLAIDILDVMGTPLMQALPSIEPFITMENSRRYHHFDVGLQGLVPGHYQVTLWIGSHNTETFDIADRCISFEVNESPTPGRTFPHAPDHGFIVPDCKHYVS